jgi:hypothetical protein
MRLTRSEPESTMFPSIPPSLQRAAGVRAAGAATALAATLGILACVDTLERQPAPAHEPAVVTASEAVRCGPVHPDS